MTSDPHDLQRFIDAQETMYDKALAELKAGRKQDHWMWFTFPQTAKVGMSSVSRRFAIQSLDEAEAYLEHPLLGARLVECTEAVLSHENTARLQIFDDLDRMKFESSMMLFTRVVGDGSLFGKALERF